MKKIVLFLFSFVFAFGSVDVSQITAVENENANFISDKNISTSDSKFQQEKTVKTDDPIPVFGAHLFNGNFKNYTQRVYNPDYKIAVGDQISLKIWGAVEFERVLIVDSQGNIFI
ncbi:sugar ABC transporter substrate-binding protein, partial [Campylobacter sp. BCW_8712]